MSASQEISAVGPVDDIHYREYKIILKPEPFTTKEAFRDFWKLVRHTAKHYDVKVEEMENPFENHIREVLFFDTENFDLFNNHFILRLRTFHENGWPVGIPELTLKYRHPEYAAAAAVDVRPTTPGQPRIKFKEELLPLRTQLGGIRSMFSHNCVLALPRVALNVAVKDISSSFPAIQRVEVSSEAPISLVNDLAVEEVQVDIAHLHFGHGLTGKASIAVWRDRKREKPLCGEFAFQCKFEKSNALHHSSLAKADDFYKAVQLDASDWVQLATTKTAMIYGLGKTTATNSE